MSNPPLPTTEATAIAAEGARVGIVTCATCGAAILLDPRARFDVLEVHRLWHEDNRHV